MVFLENRLENKIIEKLSKGPLLSPYLVSSIVKEHSVTEQGVYKALSFLIEQEIVTKNKKMISLNMLWIEKLNNLTNEISEAYYSDNFSNFLMLDDKEKMTYNFKDTTKLDVHWMHIILLMLKRFPDEPFVLFNPHCWFLIDREQTESAFFDWIHKNNKTMFFLIGGTTQLDKTIKKQVESANIKIQLDNDEGFPKDKYIAVIGEYIIYSSYGISFNDEVHAFFQTHKEFNEETISDFKLKLNKNNKSKVVIERNKDKAIKLSKQITRNHYVPLEIKEKKSN